jgi:hypothetical protein
MPTQGIPNDRETDIGLFAGSARRSDVSAAEVVRPQPHPCCLASADGRYIDEAHRMHPRGLPPVGALTRFLYVSRFPLAASSKTSA